MSETLTVGAAVVRLDDRMLIGPRGRTRLKPQPAQLLAVLARARGNVVSRARLLDELWGERPDGPAEQSVAVVLTHVRRSLADVGARVQVRNVRKAGYFLHALDTTAVPRLLSGAQARLLDQLVAAAARSDAALASEFLSAGGLP